MAYCLCSVFCVLFVSRGAVKNKMTKVTYICRSAKKKVATYFILFLFLFLFLSIFLKGVFGAFRNKGSSKTRKKLFSKKSISAHHKKCGFFPLRFFFPPSVVLFDFFYRVFGRFVTRGVQKRHKKNRAKISSASKKSTFFFINRVSR